MSKRTWAKRRAQAPIRKCLHCGHPFRWLKHNSPKGFCSRSCGGKARYQARLIGQSCELQWGCCFCGAFFVSKNGTKRCKEHHGYQERSHLVACLVCGAWFSAKGPALYCSKQCQRQTLAARNGRRRAKQLRQKRSAAAPSQRIVRSHIYERDGWRCQLCNRPVKQEAKVPHPLAPTLDHIIPLARGGTHEPSNVQTAHFICNSRKGDRGNDQLRLPLAA